MFSKHCAPFWTKNPNLAAFEGSYQNQMIIYRKAEIEPTSYLIGT